MKKILLVSTFIMVSVLMFGCSSNRESKNEINVVSEGVSESVQLQASDLVEENMKMLSVPVPSSEDVVNSFIGAIATKNYDLMRQLSLASVDVSNEDFDEFIKIKLLNELRPNNYHVSSIHLSDESPNSFRVTIGVNGREFDCFVEVTEQNSVDLSELYISKFILDVPDDFLVVLEGEDITNLRIPGSNVIELNNVSKSEKKVIVKSKFGEKIFNINPVEYMNEPYQLLPIAIPDYEKEAMLWYVDTLNVLMNKASVSADISEVLPYFDEKSFTVESIEDIYNQMKVVHQGIDVKIESIEQYIDNEGQIMESVILSNDGTIRLTHYLNYSWFEYNDKSMKLLNQVTLVKTEDGFKISSLLKEGRVLIWVNEFTNDSL